MNKYYVKSRSDPSKLHVILDLETFFECDCKQFEFKKKCRHIEEVKKRFH